MSERLIEVKGCARCGGEHVLLFLALRRPCGPYSYWAQCPTSLEPVLMLERPLSLHGRVGVHGGIALGRGDLPASLKQTAHSGRKRRGW